MSKYPYQNYGKDILNTMKTIHNFKIYHARQGKQIARDERGHNNLTIHPF